MMADEENTTTDNKISSEVLLQQIYEKKDTWLDLKDYIIQNRLIIAAVPSYLSLENGLYIMLRRCFAGSHCLILSQDVEKYVKISGQEANRQICFRYDDMTTIKTILSHPYMLVVDDINQLNEELLQAINERNPECAVIFMLKYGYNDSKYNMIIENIHQPEEKNKMPLHTIYLNLLSEHPKLRFHIEQSRLGDKQLQAIKKSNDLSWYNIYYKQDNYVDICKLSSYSSKFTNLLTQIILTQSAINHSNNELRVDCNLANDGSKHCIVSQYKDRYGVDGIKHYLQRNELAVSSDIKSFNSTNNSIIVLATEEINHISGLYNVSNLHFLDIPRPELVNRWIELCQWRCYNSQTILNIHFHLSSAANIENENINNYLDYSNMVNNDNQNWQAIIDTAHSIKYHKNKLMLKL